MSPVGFRSGVPALVRSAAELLSWNSSHYKVWWPLLLQLIHVYLPGFSCDWELDLTEN